MTLLSCPVLIHAVQQDSHTLLAVIVVCEAVRPATVLWWCCIHPPLLCCAQYVLELDSSTADKFSRHLLLRVPGYAFRDNAQVGALARLLTCRAEALQHFYLAKAKAQPGAGAATSGDGVSTAADTADMPPEQQQTTRQPAARSCFVDGAVYSRNRHFRLLGSCKGGKRAVLEPTLRWSMSAASQCVVVLCCALLYFNCPPFCVLQPTTLVQGMSACASVFVCVSVCSHAHVSYVSYDAVDVPLTCPPPNPPPWLLTCLLVHLQQ